MIPTSAAEHTIETLEKELNAAQAKIVLLDSEIKDKDQERGVLWARIKLLEEKQNKDIIDQYFPHPETTRGEVPRKPPSPPSSSNSPCPPCFSQTSATTGPTSTPQSSMCSCSSYLGLSPRIPCFAGVFLPSIFPHCNHASHPIHQVCEHAVPARVDQTQAEEIAKLRAEVNRLTKFLPSPSSSLSASVSPADISPPSRHPTVPSSDHGVSLQSVQEQGPTQDFDIAASNLTATSDASAASIEEFMDDIEENLSDTPPLNCQVPTSQQQLMLP